MTFRKNEPRCDEPSEMTEAEQRLFIMTKLSNPWWRLNHLYKIQNEKVNWSPSECDRAAPVVPEHAQ